MRPCWERLARRIAEFGRRSSWNPRFPWREHERSQHPQREPIGSSAALNPAGNPADRAAITDRVAQLLGEQPWAAYDEQSADAIASRLDRVDLDTARQVRSYERNHKGRSGVVKAAERRIERG